MVELVDIGGKSLLPIMAVEAEYGRALAARFNPFFCGVGPVEAGIAVARVLERLKGEGKKIDLVVSLGSAGSAKLPQGSVHQVCSVSYRDMDASALGFEKGLTPFSGLPAIVENPQQIPGLSAASLSTGANIVSGDAYAAIAADMVDMETWAIMRACLVAGIPMIGLRGISDGSEPLSRYEHWADYLEAVDGALANAWDRVTAFIEVEPPEDWWRVAPPQGA